MYVKFRTRSQYVIVSASCVVFFAAMIFTATASAQTVILRVDGISGSATPAGFGNDWGSNAYRYIPDAITRANTLLGNAPAPDLVQIWVRGATGAGLTYKPDQGSDRGGAPSARRGISLLRHAPPPLLPQFMMTSTRSKTSTALSPLRSAEHPPQGPQAESTWSKSVTLICWSQLVSPERPNCGV